MANKRRIEVNPGTEEPEAEEEAPLTDRDISLKAGWRDWGLRVYLKYFYVLGVLFAATLVPLEMMRSIDGDISYAVVFVYLLVMLPSAIFVYDRLWGENGPWGKKKSLR